MSRFVNLARGWIGTPYLHQARRKGAGCDCLGLILGVWGEAGGTLPPVPAYSADWSEPGGCETLWQAAENMLRDKALGDATPGDVILFRMRQGGVAKHLGLQSMIGPNARFIHSYSGYGVVESHLTPPWQRRIVARFAFPTIGG